jgi:hypothetical protein
MTECYDFPEMVVHEVGCPYSKGGICFPRPSSEAPTDTVKHYFGALEFRRTGAQVSPDGEFTRVRKPGGVSIDPHTGEPTG